jgi:hypothetical protein
MFTLDPIITDLNVKERNIHKIFFSMNIHKVATPEMMLEDARSYALIFRESKGKFSAYIALHLLSTNRKLYYSHVENPFLDDQLETINEEATAFAESLGAMLDEIDFTKLSDSEQDRWLDGQEIFLQPKPADSSPQTIIAVQPQPAASTAAEQPAQAIPAPAQPVPTLTHIQQVPAAASLIHDVSKASVTTQQSEQTFRPSPPVSSVPPEPKIQKQTTIRQTRPIKTEETVPSTVQQPKLQKKPEPLKQQHNIMQEAIKAGIAKPPKQTESKEPLTATVNVRRDREALARLLTSF